MSQARPPTPAPPDPFAPGTTIIEAGATLYGVYTNLFRPTECKPRFGEGGRFHFFGDPPVPVLHLADSREAALAERLLRNIPVEHPEPLRRSAYRNEVLAGLAPARPLRPAQFFGLGLRQLGIEATQLTDTPETHYAQTRAWAAAAHRLGPDGIAWMSKRDNRARAYMLFGDRVAEQDLQALPGPGLAFCSGAGFDWLVDTCAPPGIAVMPR